MRRGKMENKFFINAQVLFVHVRMCIQYTYKSARCVLHRNHPSRVRLGFSQSMLLVVTVTSSVQSQHNSHMVQTQIHASVVGRIYIIFANNSRKISTHCTDYRTNISRKSLEGSFELCWNFLNKKLKQKKEIKRKKD